MPAARRHFTRDDPATRQTALISAALDLMAEDGPQAATVRAISGAAGLSQGMIRHHFRTKEELMNAAYKAHMDAQIAAAENSAIPVTDPARTRLQRLISASLTPPVCDPRAISLWAGFIHMIRRDPAMRATHEAGYLRFRDRLQGLIAALLREAGRDPDEAEARRLAIACNAVLDGLWLEGGALPDAFQSGELAEIALGAIGAILEMPVVSEEAKP
ncbi:MAG: TetR family transcriptional regulator C-terminal domain-containing protein [Paracoccaceae bacterium]